MRSSCGSVHPPVRLSLVRDPRACAGPPISQVMVNGPDDVFVERKGRIERVADRPFEGEEAVLHVIERIVGSWVFGSKRRRGSQVWLLHPLPPRRLYVYEFTEFRRDRASYHWLAVRLGLPRTAGWTALSLRLDPVQRRIPKTERQDTGDYESGGRP